MKLISPWSTLPPFLHFSSALVFPFIVLHVGYSMETSFLHHAEPIGKMIIYHTVEVALQSHVRKGWRSDFLRDFCCEIKVLWQGTQWVEEQLNIDFEGKGHNRISFTYINQILFQHASKLSWTRYETLQKISNLSRIRQSDTVWI